MSYIKNIIDTKKAPAAVGTYSQGVKHGDTFFFSGQIPLNPETMEMPSTFQEQIDQVMNNIDGLLQSQDLNRENIIKTTIFLTDLGNFPIVNKAYEDYFSKPYPARSCVEVSRLPKDCLVEIEVIAAE
jgi:2-iminobutanoate/2-iminopropanoate deaminase